MTVDDSPTPLTGIYKLPHSSSSGDLGELVAGAHLGSASSGGGVTIEVRPVHAAYGVIITVSGAVAASDVARLARLLRRELDDELSVIVVDLSAVPTCHREGAKILSHFRDQARNRGVAWHLVHFGAPAARSWLTAAGLL